MPDNLVQLPVSIGTLPPAAVGETRQEFAQKIADRLLVYLPSDNSTFVIGGSQPTSDEGPWFKEVLDPKTGNSGYELWVWSADAGTYKPLTLNQVQLRYYVGTAAPDQAIYDIWVEIDTDGAPLGIYTYNSTAGAWEKYAYTVTEIDDFFEGTDSGKKQVDWERVVNKPANANNLPRAVNGSSFTPNYDWEQVYHTDIGQLIVYDPGFGWKTVTGGIGDLKEIKSGLPIGSAADFTSGTFSTILGRNPGWELDTASQGRVVVGANPSVTWNSLTALTKASGNIYGADEITLTRAELPNFILDVNIPRTNDTVGGGPVTNGWMTGDAGPITNIYQLQSEAVGDGDPHNNIQQSIAYWRVVKVS